MRKPGLYSGAKLQASTTTCTSFHPFGTGCPHSRSRCSHSAAVQAQGFSDGFWRSYSNQASAQTAWTAYTRDGIFPDYGRGPWIVVLGRKPGVFEKVYVPSHNAMAHSLTSDTAVKERTRSQRQRLSRRDISLLFLSRRCEHQIPAFLPRSHQDVHRSGQRPVFWCGRSSRPASTSQQRPTGSPRHPVDHRNTDCTQLPPTSSCRVVKGGTQARQWWVILHFVQVLHQVASHR